MYVGYSKEHEAMRDELRAYYTQLLTPEVEDQLRGSEGAGEAPRAIFKQMSADGWVGLQWPKEWGGKELGPMEQYVFFDESMRAGAPVPMLTINSVAPTIMRFGSDEQKNFFIPKILAGEIHFAIGYTEADAGTDLASLRTRAVRDGDEYVINGQKVFTSLATDADYIWLAVRTNTEVKKHKGISIIIVPTDTPGFSVQPIDNFGSVNTNITTYDNVRVPAANLVGEENQGWNLITNQLNHERVTLCSSGVIDRQLHDVREWAQNTRLADGSRVIDQDWVQLNLARVHAKLEFLKLANWRIASNASNGAPLNPADASTIKVYGTEFYMEAARLLLEVMGPAATLRRGSPDAVLRGRLEALVRSMHILTFGGGTNEMQRDLIAIFGLNMPGSPR
ncbi:MAG TPA: acyl-CoA dehydrogenase family protein [Acidimicrobiia bacterium]|jgi:alkylation response protein AidB-like acyl-CoA dehydrogenase|nr:acyl-CoA dehydrogenase family protein [Acidimicrobiia bacterium]